MTDIIQQAGQFGPEVFVFIVFAIFMFWMWRESEKREQQRYAERQKLNETMLGVVTANTQANQKLCDVIDANCEKLSSHDTKVDALKPLIESTHATTQRIEGKLDQALKVR